MTAPGQTVGVSVFVDPMIADLGVSRSEISIAYFVGTLTGATALPSVGRWIDRVGVRRVMLIIGGRSAPCSWGWPASVASSR